jgi:hypothetical protein
MPWKNINQILGLAYIDPNFWKALQEDPLPAIDAQGFELTSLERVLFGKIAIDDLDTFCQSLVDTFAPDILKPL